MNGLLIDSCGVGARLALFADDSLIVEREIAGRGFSAEWAGALREMLAAVGWSVPELTVVGVVHGPGSFTGVRVGLAVAKGLCEATGAKLIAVSRLAALAALGADGALAVLDAGRDEFYVRDAGDERLWTRDELIVAAQERDVVTVDAQVAEVLGESASVALVELQAVSALPILLQRWSCGSVDDVATIDANYVRGERDIYARKPAASGSAK
ncbi:MAG: tRNA (adenosine(37)-N6)-threonylcarbamoyltransferase complex dimerization subunit type 1 TsaB [Acidobacteriaceae bacterium]